MFKLRNDVVLNHALVSRRPLDSGAFAVRATLLHVFGEAGDHDVLILRDGRLRERFSVTVQPGGAPTQVNIDLAGPLADGYSVRAGGVVGFYAAQGRERYAVVVKRAAPGQTQTVLDSRERLPVNDLFAVILVHPGTYRARNLLNRTELRAAVRMPRRGEAYDPAQPTLILAGEQGFEPEAAQILAGQSLVLLARTPARFVVELEEAAPDKP